MDFRFGKTCLSPFCPLFSVLKGSFASTAAVSTGVIIVPASWRPIDEVVLAYVKSTQYPFNLSANDMLRLKDAGIPSPIITAMLSHDNTLRSQNPGGPALNASNQPPVPP